MSLLVVLVGAVPASAGLRRPELIASFEAASALVIGRVTGVEALAHGAYLARVKVERSLRGEGSPGAVLEVVWEEPVPSLPARFQTGDRALLALAALPTASIWRTRLPDDAQRAGVVAIALSGDAHLLRPTAGDLTALEHFLALDSQARSGDAGLVYLFRLAARAEPGLARAALLRVAATPAFSARPVPEVAAQSIVDTLLRRDDPALANDTLEWLERDRPDGVRSVVAARAAAFAPAPVPAVLRAADGALRGEIDEVTALAMLEAADEDSRIVAARYASGPHAAERLRRLLVRDPAPAVRAAAVARLLALEGEEALYDALGALDDPEARVRHSAVESIARLDPVAVPELRVVVETGSPEAARSAIGTLSLMGAEAHAVLAEIAAESEDPGLRALAGIAVGRPLGHAH